MKPLLIAALLLAAEFPSPSSPKIDAAEQAAYNSNFTRARALFAEVAKSDARQENRDRAALRLANIQWRIDERPDDARRTLAPLVAGGAEQWGASLELARLERDQKNWSAAQKAALAAVKFARTEWERRAAIGSYVLAVVEPQKRLVLDGGKVSDRDALVDAVKQLRPIVEAEPGRLTRSLALLDAAVLAGDADTMRVAWRSYFVTAAPSAILDHARELIAGDDIARGLAESRLFDEAAMLDPSQRDVARYARFLRDATKRTNDYYRQVAKHDGVVQAADRDAWHRDLRALAEGMWKDVVGTPFDQSQMLDAPDGVLAKRFGTYISIGDTGKRANAHGGHKVLDETREVTQYAHHAKTRFIVLDTMLSNGYDTWAWDGRGQHGGWGEAGLIVQVRPAYAEGGLGAWRKLTEPGERKREDEDLARETKLDEERAKKDPYAYLPGLALRLRRQSAERLLARVPRREDWLREMARMEQESSIFAHEGRHAIDAQDTKIQNDAELEYRAKLSEIAFAPDPRLALVGGIIDANIGASSPHGQANLRVMKGFVAWMKAHKKGDPARPLLPQLDTLTDEELREAARSLDPFFRVPSPR